MKLIFKQSIFAIILLEVMALQSCKKDFDIITGATTEQTFSSPRATTAVVVGLQRLYSQSVVSAMCNANSLVTNEAILVNVGNLSEAQLVAGGATVDNTNALLGSLWANLNKVIYDADNAIRAATNNNFAAPPALGGQGYASGVLGYATIFKAMALANIAQFWDNVPDSVGLGIGATTPTTFSPRAQGFTKAIAAIDRALAAIQANPISTSFIADLPAGVDIVNTLNALKARYSLYLGNYTAALNAANTVDLTRAVVFNFEAANPNIVFQAYTSTNNVIQPIDSTFGLPIGLRPALNDARVPFYTTINPTVAPRFRFSGFWNSAVRAIPVYLPDEMRLIRAECLLRQSTPDPAAAKLLIDAVLQQPGSADPVGVGANIAAGYTGVVDVPSLLDEVYRNRCIELFFTGLKLEDMRRFNRPQSEMKRRFFPYPLNERINNSNTPPDPAF
jgi:starch-binding outer membrane protein, SusD/RagB family